MFSFRDSRTVTIQANALTQTKEKGKTLVAALRLWHQLKESQLFTGFPLPC